MRAAVAAGLVGVLVGCGGGVAVTYHRDVAPIVDARCAGCHAPGGLAPFSLTSYEDARPRAKAIADATASGGMPPWLPADGCGDFRDARRLSAAEIATFAAWADTGAPAGDPASAPPPTTTAGAAGDRGPPGATLDPGAAYVPQRTATDDHRCFLIDPALSSARDLIGFEVHPGTPASVHHVLLFTVAPSQVAAAQAKDAAEPGIGWTCFAGTGLGSGREAPPAIGGWVPGAGGAAFPSGTGIRLAPGTWIVMQVHYNLSVQHDVSDRTTADLFYADAPVAKRAFVLPLANQDFVIPAGAIETVTAELPAARAWELWGVAPHMHLRGTKIGVTIAHPDGSTTCVVDIPRWDFHWQEFYYYRQPIAVAAGDVGRLACTFDNSAGTEPLRWGERTTDEMCLTFGYFTAP
jgi:hypothetical protein